LYGLPEPPPGSDCWVDIAGAAVLTGAAPKTITSWLVRGGPARNPFPRARRFLYRLYWPKAEIDAWREIEQRDRRT
jgi:predicted DNA-binding transcriptional regulator AlpA